MTKMQYRKLGSSELNVSILGLGCLHFGGYLNESESLDLISYAINQGINFIDTGPLYGNGLSEGIVGKAIRSCRDQIVLSTKVGLSRCRLADGSFGVEVVPLTAAQIRESLDNSLKEIGTDYIDVFQFHAYDPSTPLEESLGEMNRLIDEGKIRSIAVSNYNPNELKAVLDVIHRNSWQPIVAIETHYNVLERMVEQELLPLCDRNQVSIVPYRSLARGILSEKYSGGMIPANSRAADSWRVRKWLLPETLAVVSSFADFAKQSGRTVTELALAWLYSKKNIGSVLIGGRDIGQLELCLNSCDWTLDCESLIEIDRLIDLHGQSDHVTAHPKVYFEK
jgi:aryl-alcohol dehydrogenase-like predicted oxidoreductase